MIKAATRVIEAATLCNRSCNPTYPRWDDPRDGIHTYCAPALTAAARRLPRLLEEVLAFRADVLCLQDSSNGIYREEGREGGEGERGSERGSERRREKERERRRKELPVYAPWVSEV